MTIRRGFLQGLKPGLYKLQSKLPATVRDRYNGLESAHIAADAVRRTKGLRSKGRT
jgi:hypothetical protein